MNIYPNEKEKNAECRRACICINIGFVLLFHKYILALHDSTQGRVVKSISFLIAVYVACNFSLAWSGHLLVVN
jgi:hypothetical protein